ncbi:MULTISPECIES: ALF repeat-containing protein [unclassified Streptomyces]|uniref:ALF repeat-containing protein n=1 Tax=unclassified Streptomyces TaxID=2593676 RepID=UPI002365BCD6|nr:MULTISPECIES: ALF repeat-containing protein [unclassified Streptomyces]MDF3144542.1 ALF repeat-containing protein [Streptomyces sp. T21Q-yed]WDF40697.1 ALF repeat-containing protein [Streptomyces sp. T12]
MRPTRTALALVATIALAPALLLAGPAFAAESTPSSAATVATASDAAGSSVDEMSDDDVRVAIARIIADPTTGKAVYAAAQAALDGTIEDQRYFLETGRWIAQAEDDRVAIARILFTATQNGDKAVVREADKALDTNTPEALRAFLETGYRLAQAEDDRVAVARILADPTISDALRAAAEQAIDGTPEELRYFLEVGQYEVDG